MNNIDKLNDVLKYVKQAFIGKDEIVDLLGVSLVARENAFLLGPPGTAKSAIIRLLSQCVEDGKNFEYLLTRFTEPNEIFGPFDIRKLKDGELITNTEGMMPEASMVFLDEIFNANSAILNSLLMALNERIFRRGKETKKLPWGAYVPFLGTFFNDPVGQLRKLKVDISVITERLASSIKIAGEPYLSEIHSVLVDKLDLKNWADGIDRKLNIIEDVQTFYQQKIDTHREDIFSILVIILIFVEVMFGFLNFLRG